MESETVMNTHDAGPSADYPRIGIVLSSGGVRGVYAHTGFLQALADARAQAEALLSPYQEALRKDPRGKLPHLSSTCSQPATKAREVCHDV